MRGIASEGGAQQVAHAIGVWLVQEIRRQVECIAADAPIEHGHAGRIVACARGVAAPQQLVQRTRVRLDAVGAGWAVERVSPTVGLKRPFIEQRRANSRRLPIGHTHDLVMCRSANGLTSPQIRQRPAAGSAAAAFLLRAGAAPFAARAASFAAACAFQNATAAGLNTPACRCLPVARRRGGRRPRPSSPAAGHAAVPNSPDRR